MIHPIAIFLHAKKQNLNQAETAMPVATVLFLPTPFIHAYQLPLVPTQSY